MGDRDKEAVWARPHIDRVQVGKDPEREEDSLRVDSGEGSPETRLSHRGLKRMVG